VSISEWRWTMDRVSISEQCCLFVGINLGRVDRSKTHLGFHFEVRFNLYLVWIYFFIGFSHCYWCFQEEIRPRLISPR